MVHKIISGGQTGVDRAALDVAIELGLQHGGWCPKGRKAELGEIIPFKYSLKETQSSFFSERTILNLCQSDGTLVITNRYPLEVNDGTVVVKQNRTPH